MLFHPKAGVSNKYLAAAMLTDSIMRRVTSLAKATAGQHNIGVDIVLFQRIWHKTLGGLSNGLLAGQWQRGLPKL